MKCEVEGNEIVLRLPKENIAFYAENYQDCKIISDEFYVKFAELILELHDYSEDTLINKLFDRVFEELCSYYPQYCEVQSNER